MNFLNNGTGYKLFAEAALCDTYVDKTMMIDTLYRYVCAGKNTSVSPDPGVSENR